MPFYHQCYTKGFAAGYDGQKYVQAIPHDAGYSTVWASADLNNHLASDMEKISTQIASPIFEGEYASTYLIPNVVNGRSVLGHYRNHMDGNFVDGRINYFIHNILMDNADFKNLIYSRDATTGQNLKMKHLLSARLKDTYVKQQTAPNELSYEEPVTASLKHVSELEADDGLAQSPRYTVSYEAARSIVYYILKTSQPIVITLCDKQEPADSSRSSQTMYARALSVMMALYEILPCRALEAIGFVAGLNTFHPPKICRLLFCSRQVAEKVKSAGLKEAAPGSIVFIDDERKEYSSVLPASKSKIETAYLDMLARYIADGNRTAAKKELDKIEGRYRMTPHSVLFLASIYAALTEMAKPDRNNNEAFKLIFDSLWKEFRQNKNNVLDNIKDDLRDWFNKMEIAGSKCDDALVDYISQDSIDLEPFIERFILKPEDKEHIQNLRISCKFGKHDIPQLCEDLKQNIDTPSLVKAILLFMQKRWDKDGYDGSLSKKSEIQKAYDNYNDNDDIRTSIETLVTKEYESKNFGQLCWEIIHNTRFAPIILACIFNRGQQHQNTDRLVESKHFSRVLDTYQEGTRDREKLVGLARDEWSNYDTGRLCSQLKVYRNQKDCVKTILDCMEQRCLQLGYSEAKNINIDIVIDNSYIPYADDTGIRNSLSNLAAAKLCIEEDFYRSYFNRGGSLVNALLFQMFACKQYEAFQFLQQYSDKYETFTQQLVEAVKRCQTPSAITDDIAYITNAYAFQLASRQNALSHIVPIKRIPFAFEPTVNDKIKAAVDQYVKTGIIASIQDGRNAYGSDALDILSAFREETVHDCDLVAEAVTAVACTGANMHIPDDLIQTAFRTRSEHIGRMINGNEGAYFPHLGWIDAFAKLEPRFRYTQFLQTLGQSVPTAWKENFVNTYHYDEYPTYNQSMSLPEKLKLAFEKNETRDRAISVLYQETETFANQLAQNICTPQFNDDVLYNQCAEIIDLLNRNKGNKLYTDLSFLMDQMLYPYSAAEVQKQMDFASYVILIANLMDLQYHRISRNAQWLLEASDPKECLMMSDNDAPRDIDYFAQVSDTVCQYWGNMRDSEWIARKITRVDDCLNEMLSDSTYTGIKKKLKEKYGIPKEADLHLCALKIAQSHQKTKAARQKKKNTRASSCVVWILIMIIIALASAIVVILLDMISKYNYAINLKNRGHYEQAASVFEELHDYKDAKAQAVDCKYELAVRLASDSDYKQAALMFGKLQTYQDSEEQSYACWNQIADRARIASGTNHTLALTSDGRVIAMGNHEKGQCLVWEWRDVIAISAGNEFSLGLKSDGTVVSAGDNTVGQCNVSDWTKITSISAGYLNSLGLKSDGSIVVAGCNDDGQCDISGWRNVGTPTL